MALKEWYGKTQDGKDVDQYVIRNKNGMEVRCINYGCRLTNILVPDGKGGMADLVLGYDNLAGYEHDVGFHGAFIGRYANRIEGAAFTMDGKTYKVTQNEGENYLHGSYHATVFNAEAIGENSVSFTYISPDGEDGFPGEVWLGVIYTLTDENELVMDYRAVPKANTHINLTNHSYFNLAGQDELNITDQTLWMNSRTMLETAANLCPTGRVVDIEGGAFDFNEAKPIGRDINAEDPQIELGGGYDHCFILEKNRPAALTMAAMAREPISGRTLRVYTTQPAIQFYSGNMLEGSVAGKNGRPFARRSGYCLETQHYPCSPNYPEFPTTLVEHGEKFHEVTVYQFGW